MQRRNADGLWPWEVGVIDRRTNDWRTRFAGEYRPDAPAEESAAIDRFCRKNATIDLATVWFGLGIVTMVATGALVAIAHLLAKPAACVIAAFGIVAMGSCAYFGASRFARGRRLCRWVSLHRTLRHSRTAAGVEHE